MQNLVGVLFLLLVLYFSVKWFDEMNNRKYGVLTFLALICSIFTHIYTGMLAVIIFLMMLIFSIIYKSKRGETFNFNLKILGILLLLTCVGVGILFSLYPVMFNKFITVLSFFNNSTETSQMMSGFGGSPIIFLSLPFILGLLVTLKILWSGILENTNFKRLLMAFVYLVLVGVIIFLSTFPSIDSQYQNRFLMLAFVPIALIAPLSLICIVNLLKSRIAYDKQLILVAVLAIIFAFSGFYSASQDFSSMEPSITQEQFNGLVAIKTNYLGNQIDSNAVIIVNDYHTGYWVEYVLGTDVVTGNVSEVQSAYPNRKIYSITLNESTSNKLNVNSESWSPFLPYSLPWLSISIGSNNKNLMNTQPPNMNGSNFNGSPLNGSNLGNSGMNGTNRMNISDQGNLELGSGTLIYSSNDVTIYEVS